MKIQQESASGPLTKVLELLKSSNFAFGRFSSTLEKFGEKQTSISAQYKVLSCSVDHISKFAQFWTKLQLENL